jgi:8-oxo-dGTP pyrophosphatase MutT (NUDIX family)
MKKRVRAIISEGEKYLFIHRIKGDKEYWVIPGGGVEDEDASLEAALVRECEEELGVQIEVGEFCMNTYFEMDGETHEQHIFHCRILGGELGSGQGPEFQEGSGYEGSFVPEWVHRQELEGKYILPQELRKLLSGDDGKGGSGTIQVS